MYVLERQTSGVLLQWAKNKELQSAGIKGSGI